MGLSDVLHGQTIATALYGTIIGALLGGIPSEKYGRKNTGDHRCAVPCFIHRAAVAPDVVTFMVFRFIGGLGVGASSIVAPMYISEITGKTRGRLVAIFQFNIVFGILISYFTNYLIPGSWRKRLALDARHCGHPCFNIHYLLFFVPESPRWLMVKLQNMMLPGYTFYAVSDPLVWMMPLWPSRKNWKKKNRKQASAVFQRAFYQTNHAGILIALFNQLSGINAIISEWLQVWWRRVFEMALIIGEDAAFLQKCQCGTGQFNFYHAGIIFNWQNLAGKMLVLIGSVGYIISLAVVSGHFILNGRAWWCLYLFLFIDRCTYHRAGAVIWVVISEIFSTSNQRSYGTNAGLFHQHWVLAACLP